MEDRAVWWTLMTYFTRRRHDVIVTESFDLVRFNLPQQSFNLQLNLPLSVNTYGDHDGAEKNEAKYAGDNHRQHMSIVLCAMFIFEATLRFIGGNGAARPINTHDVVELVFLRKMKAN